MVTREDLVAEIQNVPERHLEELYKIVKDLQEQEEVERLDDESVMAKLRRIKISAAPDFSVKDRLGI